VMPTRTVPPSTSSACVILPLSRATAGTFTEMRGRRARKARTVSR
jgi:hypothetical protein